MTIAADDRFARALEPHLDRLLTPALVIDLDAVDHNVGAIIARIGVDHWRPHVKTVKQSIVLRTLLDRGVRHFKTATIDELALVLRTASERATDVDVLLAYPACRATCRAALTLQARHRRACVSVLADSPEHLTAMDGWVSAMAEPSRLTVALDVNLGMNRTGSTPQRWLAGGTTLMDVRNLDIVAVHGYDGHIQWTERELAHAGYDALCALVRALPLPGLRDVVTSGTHSYAHALEHHGLAAAPWRHQVSPGTVIFSDLRSAPAARDLGLRQAAYVATRVVSAPTAGQITLDAGSKAVAPDRPAPGCSVLRWSDLEPLARSEEHMPVRVGGDEAPAVGSVLFLVPEHVCTTVNLYRRALWLRGDTVVGHGPVEAMSHSLWAEEALS